MKPIFMGLSIVATFVSFAPFAVADDASNKMVRTELVNYSDLNAQTTAGARALYSRLKGAAGDVCGARPDIRELRVAKDARECRARAVNDAVAQIDSESLRTLHAQHSYQVTVASTVEARQAH